MPYKVIPAQRIARLQRTVSEKQRILQRLEQEHTELENKHLLLASTCEVLAILRQCRASRDSATTSTAGDSYSSSLAEEELQQIDLSQQLEWIYESLPHPDAHHLLSNLPEPISRASNSSSCDSTADAPANQDPHSTISPADDPLQHLRGYLLSREQDTAATGLLDACLAPPASIATLQQLQQTYCDCVVRLSAHVGFLESSAGTAAAGTAAAGTAATPSLINHHAQGLIKLVSRYLRLVSDLVQHHREDLLSTFCLSNVVTGELREQDSSAYVVALQQLDLSRQQQDLIVACSGFYDKLLSAVVADRSRSHQHHDDSDHDDHHHQQQQQQHVKASGPHSDSDSSSSIAAASAADSAIAEGFMCQQAQHQRRQWQQMQVRQQRLQSLDVSIGKELMLIHATMYALWGRLTWLQAGKLMIACFPQPAVPVFLAAVLKEQQQQQQRQQVRPPLVRRSK